MPHNGTNGELTQRINELYWDSDSTVGAISRDLEIGRNALYAAVVPIPSGAICLECGEETVYTNRTNRAAGSAVCRGCEDSALADRTGAGAGATGRSGSGAFDEDSELQRWDRWREDLRSVPPQRAAMIGGAAALGLVVGAAAARAIRNG